MKKRLEQDLISIAHKILKLSGKEDIKQLYEQSKVLYEKLAILNFYENNYLLFDDKIDETQLEKSLGQYEKSSTIGQEFTNEIDDANNNEVIVHETTESQEESVEEEAKETIVENVEPETKEDIAIDDVEETKEEDLPQEEIEDNQPKSNNLLDFDVIIDQSFKEVEFTKVEDQNINETLISTVQTETTTIKKEETQTVVVENKANHSVNDLYNKSLTFGLNDRIAFVKHLFDGSNEDFNRVVSQINSFTSLNEAQEFIANMVKPEYSNWTSKEDYEQRFLEIIEKKFD